MENEKKRTRLDDKIFSMIKEQKKWQKYIDWLEQYENRNKVFTFIKSENKQQQLNKTLNLEQKLQQANEIVSQFRSKSKQTAIQLPMSEIIEEKEEFNDFLDSRKKNFSLIK